MQITDRQQFVQLVRQWGGTTSDAVLDPACKIFSIPEVEGCIAYRAEKKCVVVYGDPICAPDDRPVLAQSFYTHCNDQKLSVIYMVVSESYQRWSVKNGCSASIAFGEELSIDPHDDPQSHPGLKGSLVRRKVRHASNEGVKIEEYKNHDTHIKQELENVAISWLKRRRGFQIHISNVFLFNDCYGKRWFYAMQNDRVIGVIVLNQLKSHNGWLLNHLMTSPDAPHGTAESLVVTALDHLRLEGCHYVTFGAVPALHLGEVVGLGTFATNMAHLIYKIAKKIFRLESRKIFWEKFHPKSRPSYLLLNQSTIGISEIWGMMRALNISF